MAWLRLIGAFVAIVVVVLLLQRLPTLAVLVIVVVASVWGVRRLRAAERTERRTGTELLGLERATEDRFGITSFPLQLFRRVDEFAVDETSWGTWRGIEVRVFGATAASPNVLAAPVVAGGGTAPPRTGFAGVLTNLVVGVPAVVLEPQVLATAFARVPALGRTSIGDAAFDGRWTVWTDDPGFARALLGPELRTWLSTLGEEWGFELSARIAMVYGRRPAQPDVVAVLHLLAGLLRRVPEDLLEHPPPTV